MLDEFKKFILKGNVVDLSTGVIIGAAFGGIVTAFTKGIVEPILRLIPGGGENIKGLAWKIGSQFKDDKGNLVDNVIDLNVIVNASINFLITAAVVFFVIIKPLSKLTSMMKKEEAAAPPPAPPADVVLLTEIRDLLKK
jgi:large conductance mechanosensitive channel